jgi:hypothetical protein
VPASLTRAAVFPHRPIKDNPVRSYCRSRRIVGSLAPKAAIRPRSTAEKGGTGLRATLFLSARQHHIP